MPSAPVVAVVGPTAAGKSRLGLDLAHALDGEVVNTDAMQLYRGMDIGTAKLHPAEREGVPHHLLDLWEVDEPASVAAYQQPARAVLDDLRARQVPAVLVGGSGLYVQALLDDLRFPPTDPMLRAQLESELTALGAAALHARLAALDPAAAAVISARNGRRVVRALEVVTLTGEPFAAALPGAPTARYEALRVGLDRPDLPALVSARAAGMWRAGLLDEVRRLERQGLREGRTARRAVGYAEALAQLDGQLGEADAIAATAAATRRLARRQRAWFRRDPRVRWLDGQPAGWRDQVLALLGVRR